MSGPDSAAQGSGDQGADEAESILGNLPRSRPSVRSPRRAAQQTPEPESEPAAGAGDGSDPAAGAGREAELEALARAGVSLAGSAATLGLRVAGRAAAALRDAVERR